MAVYTTVHHDQLEDYLSHYNIGRMADFQGIFDGVENTNYCLHTDQGKFILTLYEQRVSTQDLPFFMRLLQHLGDQGYPCPPPLVQHDGATIGTLAGRKAALFPFIEGQTVSSPNPRHCYAVGQALANLHLVSANFPAPHRENSMGFAAWEKLFSATKESADDISPGLRDDIQRTLDDIARHWPKDLPAGICHTDLFNDNVLFNGTNISGVIDFYFACHDFWLYDLATTLSNWCFSPYGSFYYSNCVTMVRAYHQIRPLTRAEHDALLLVMQASAVRFLLTRLYDWVNTPTEATVKRKDPMEYARFLRFVRQPHSPSFFGLTEEMVA